MKRIFALLLSVVLCLGFVLCPSAIKADAAVSASVYVIVANPGEDCNTQVGISWHADFDCTDCFVEYKEASDSGWENVNTIEGTYNDTDYKYFLGNTFATSTADPVFSEDHKFLNYEADIDGLTPATRYKYRIGDGKGNYSATRYFKTSGAEEYSFIWISDFHTYSPLGGRLNAATQAVAYAASQSTNGIDMIFSTGDTVAYGGSHYFWRQLDNVNWVKNYLYVDLNGNHDNMNNTDSNNTFNYFRITHNNPENCYLGGSTTPYEPGVVYYFMYNDILWFVFDNETMNATVRAQVQEWAGKVIESKEGQFKYLFISEHYQWFNGNNGADSHYGNWSDFCDKYGVDIAFAGNNHIYARTHRIYDGQVVAADGNKGTYYIQAASSDCERGTTGTLVTPATYNNDILAYRYKNTTDPARTHGVSLLSVTKDGIRLKLFGSENASQSSPSFSLKDEILITPKRADVNRVPSVDTEADGDVNDDGYTDNLDAAVVLKYDAGLALSANVDIDKGDVNDDGVVDNLDAAIILKKDAGLID